MEESKKYLFINPTGWRNLCDKWTPMSTAVKDCFLVEILTKNGQAEQEEIIVF